MADKSLGGYTIRVRKKMKRLGISVVFVAILRLARLAFLSSWKIPTPAHMVSKSWQMRDSKNNFPFLNRVTPRLFFLGDAAVGRACSGPAIQSTDRDAILYDSNNQPSPAAQNGSLAENQPLELIKLLEDNQQGVNCPNNNLIPAWARRRLCCRRPAASRPYR